MILILNLEKWADEAVNSDLVSFCFYFSSSSDSGWAFEAQKQKKKVNIRQKFGNQEGTTPGPVYLAET